MRNVFATITGFIVASLTVYFFETILGQNMFPLPENAKPMDMEWLKNNMHIIPIGAKIFVIIGHATGIFIGMYVAALIAKTSTIPSYIVGILMLVATAFNLMVLPKETWFFIADAICAIIGFAAGKKTAESVKNT